MLSRRWVGPGDYDRLVEVNETEKDAIVNHYKSADALGKGFDDGTYFYLVNDAKRVVTPLPFLALAFGGQWNDELPYEEVTSSNFSLQTLQEYRLDLQWDSPK